MHPLTVQLAGNSAATLCKSRDVMPAVFFGLAARLLVERGAIGNLWAISYAALKTLVFDGGFDKGLTGTSTHWEGFAGFTYLLPSRLWKR